MPPLLYLLMLHKEAKKVLISNREDQTVSRHKRSIHVASYTRDNISVSIRDFIEDAASIQENKFANEADKSIQCANEDNTVYTIHL